jgi:hypothetical protein
MPGMLALSLPDLALARTGLQRGVAQRALEHRQLLVRCVAQPVQRDFLVAWIGRPRDRYTSCTLVALGPLSPASGS